MLDFKETRQGRRYQIKWVDYPNPTWALEEDLVNSKAAILEYFDKANLPVPAAVQEFCHPSASNDVHSSDSESEDDSARVVIDPESESDSEDQLDPFGPPYLLL